jgi:hypothetical protein
MRRIIFSIVALAFLVVAYESTALGAGSAAGQGEITFVKVNPCVLAFAFKDIPVGTQGRLEVLLDGTVYTARFQVSERGMSAWHVHDLIGLPHPPTLVQYRIAVQGMTHVLAGSVMCDCGGGEGGGGTGGGNNGGGTPSNAGAAGAITSQPGFAG